VNPSTSIRLKGTSQAIEAFFLNEKSKELFMVRPLSPEPTEHVQQLWHPTLKEEPVCP
jgi:hypothetical protein